jgi:hypothetical protein
MLHAIQLSSRRDAPHQRHNPPAERYAIDFVQLNDNKMLYSGPQDQLSSYAFFGTEIHSVADGIVVQIADNLPEQVPGKIKTENRISGKPLVDYLTLHVNRLVSVLGNFLTATMLQRPHRDVLTPA